MERDIERERESRRERLIEKVRKKEKERLNHLREKLAALINDSVRVIATNTAVVQLSVAREKPCIALFSSEEKGKLFVPDAEVKKCKIISSKTGLLADIDIESVKAAVQIFKIPLTLV